MAIEIKSSLINDPDFSEVKKSLIEVSEIDGKDKFRVKTLEYINDSSNEDDDQFFFDMLEFVRFLKPDDDAVAYTDPYHLIYMNCPKDSIGENVRFWDFIYDHECLHQLWDTFAVGDKIKKNNIEYNHTLLNLASDCVINDYLYGIRKKARPNDLITPEWIKEKFGVEYDRKNDTQYSLYIKLLNSPKKKEIEKAAEQKEKEWSGKIKPGSVQQGPDNPDGKNGGSEKHSEDYIKGWTDGIQDVLDKKVDPTSYKPKEVKNDYDKGYNDVLDQIKQGVEKGIQQSKSSGGDGGENSDLPEIPWDTDGMPKPQDNSQSGGGKSGDKGSDNSDIDDMSGEDAAKDAEKSAKEAADASDKANNKNADPNANKEAAKDAADKAAKAAKEAKEAADKGDKKTAQEKAKEARDAAKEAKDAAEGKSSGSNSDIDKMSGKEAASDASTSNEKAAKAAKEAKEGAEKAAKADKNSGIDPEHAKEAAERAEKAAEKAEKAAKAAQEAATKGDEKTAKEKAKEARDAAKEAQEAADDANGKVGDDRDYAGGSGNGGNTPSQGHDNASDNTKSKVDLEKIKHKAEKLIEEYRNKVAGDFGTFIKKCKVSVELKESGLLVKSKFGAASAWNAKMTQYINAFVKKKIFQKRREYELTYKRPNRRAGVYKYGDPILKGKRVKKDGLTINVAFYIDRSGSMSNCINDVWKATYRLCEAIKKQFHNEKVVDKISFRMHAFDYSMHVLNYGDKMSANGGTMDFDKILDYINKNTKNYMINVILTDAGFSINKEEIKRFMKDIEGMVLFITNSPASEVEKLAKGELDTQLFYILADHAFTIDGGDPKVGMNV